ncbi:glycerophosphodiester phosphodiesterase [Caldimonas thermodepolymerans]|uniref:glycerophosphodiester phosphodiesterase n=1 Tax=Caldimonas thermodepolymerans TaxID=215580 RepID=UPI0022355A9A|nr:glycerophosphodiester phosphodiesterase [Caldimonas thermodepolymerans]UZG45312.1 glycerophosphodiester phosphodiesterase [Caldimonas thermodepolymerans]
MTTKLEPWPYPLWIAHRGAGKLAPENTLAAFREGAAHGYRMFECDAKLSADGTLFLLHDATLERTTDGQGVAGDRPWAELSRLDAGGWHGRRYAGEPVPTLEALARYVLRNGFFLNIEIKPTPGHEEATGRAVAEACARWWRDSRHPPAALPLLTSFKPAALQAARAAQPQLPRGLLLDHWRDGWRDEVRTLECVAVVAHWSMLDAATIAEVHALGCRALAYTVNDPCEAQRLLAAGITGLITDAVDRFSPGTTVLD